MKVLNGVLLRKENNPPSASLAKVKNMVLNYYF